MTKELLQQAHDALITSLAYVDATSAIAEVQGALKAIEQALAQQEQPAQEAVAYELEAVKFANGKKLVYQKPENLASYIKVRTLVYADADPAPTQPAFTQEPPAKTGARIQAIVTSCLGCTHRRYNSGGIYYCEKLGSDLDPRETFHPLCPLQSLSPTQPAQEPFKWYDGAPPFPQNQESFIAQTIYGERVVLRVLPEEYTYDYTTADGTHMKAENIKKWMQFPDCEFLPPEPAPTQPALKDDVGVACLETMVKTMTNLGIATDSSLEGFGARLETHIYAMCRAVDGIFKAQPALSDDEILNCFSASKAEGMASYMLAVGRAIEAHCRGGNHG